MIDNSPAAIIKKLISTSAEERGPASALTFKLY
jgi:hypothetical protein